MFTFQMQLALVTTWIELAISVGATPLVILVLYALLTSSLNRGVKLVFNQKLLY